MKKKKRKEILISNFYIVSRVSGFDIDENV